MLSIAHPPKKLYVINLEIHFVLPSSCENILLRESPLPYLSTSLIRFPPLVGSLAIGPRVAQPARGPHRMLVEWGDSED
jgi:hypothetical protein